MSLYPRNNETNTFPLFESLFANIDYHTVLDFGGNQGNLLYFSQGKIQPQHYTCVDVDEQAIRSGQQQFPTSTWTHFDRYNHAYNPKGDDTVFPDINNSQDVIYAFSVFTHTDLQELVVMLNWFQKLNYKKIAVSLLDIQNEYMLDFFYNKRIQTYGSCVDIKNLYKSKNYCMYLIDNSTVITNTVKLEKMQCRHLLTFYNMDFVVEYLQQHSINAYVVKPRASQVPFICIDNQEKLL